MSDYSAVNPPTEKNQSQAFAAALQRAKEIAAKIQPSSKASSTTGSISPETHKRPSEDYANSSEPERKRLATSPVALAAAQAAAVAARVAAAAAAGIQGIGGPGSQFGNVVNEEIKVPDKMVGLIIGRGGGQISRLQAETGCKIQMAPDSPGLLERSCTLTGNAQSITLAKELIQNIVQNKVSVEGTGGAKIEGLNISSPPSQPAFTQAQIMIPGAKVGLIIGKGGETIKMLQESSGAKMIVIQDGPNSQENEKPLRISGETAKVEHAKKLVYDMLGVGEKDGLSTFDQNGSNWNGSNSGDYSMHSGYGGKVEVGVPKQVVGLVIGKGGDMIKKIQADTGAKVQFINLNEDTPDDRRCLITGNPDQVAEAKQRIESLVDSALNRSGNRPSGGNFNRNQSWGNSGQTQPLNETTFTVPSAKCGVIIGKGGETIKQINLQTGAHCEIDRRHNNTGSEKTFVIRGTTEQIENAKRMINEKLGYDPNGGSQSYSNMNQPQPPYGSQMGWGGQDGQMNAYGQGWNPNMQQQQPQQPTDQNSANPMSNANGAQGSSDFSAQWIQYYRSMGMHREAEFIEQQSKQMKFNQMNGTSAVPNPANVQPQPHAIPPNGTAGVMPVAALSANGSGSSAGVSAGAGTPDYSAQWIEYYRSIGKNKEADMVEQQVKARIGQTNGQPSGGSDQSPQQQQQQQPNASSPQSGQPQSLNDVSMYGAQYGMAYGAGGYYGAQNPGAAPTGYGAYPAAGNAYAGYQQVPQQDPPQQ
ncbi:far upstream element-binding protein 3 isoform X2 [Sipha flava]|uniref:Far upstream element-binding protein 3 isoform X2 n=2 Tax=Sipha flava TaxID=143950 RepID=A0A8B8GRI7_9HEMI|nr:far upstream element-binding protein 3 isoform X2 [Sipha flava]